EIAHRSEVIGQAALKYYILDFNPRTNVQFDPEESIAFQGRTGPYCLYSYARVQSIGQRVDGWPDLESEDRAEALRALGTDREMEVVRQLEDWPETVTSAFDDLDPSAVTGYLFELAKSLSSLYNDPDHRIVELEGPRRDGLLLLARAVAETLETGLELLGIETLDEM
ncbi:MAG: DALR anticodon-binding domain-containing protein, partial [Bradymonadaceae bacterium]